MHLTSVLKQRLKRLLLLAYNAALDRQKYKFIIRDFVAVDDLSLCGDLLQTMRQMHKMLPKVVAAPEGGNRMLVIAPHPDDEVIGPGGTLIRHLERGGDARLLFLTSGDEHEAATRRAEGQAVADRLGIPAVFLDSRVGIIPTEGPFLEALSREIADYRPDHIFLPCLMDDHDDHRRANEVLWAMHKAAPMTWNPQIWGYQVYTALPANMIVDITPAAERKAEVIRLHRSQFRSRDWAHYALGLNAYNSRFLPGGVPSFAEVFFVTPVEGWVELCRRYFHSGKNVYKNPRYLAGLRGGAQ